MKSIGLLILLGAVCGGQPSPSPADRPAPRTDANSMKAHEELLEKKKQGRIDVYFEGDSITRRWGALDYPELLANWKRNFFGWNAADFGWGADRIQNILWRLENGELDGARPKVIVLLAGTNNVGGRPTSGNGDAQVEDITRGIQAVLRVMQTNAPQATIVLTAIFPRNDNMAVMPVINRINARLAGLTDGKRIRFLNVNDKLADADGKLFANMMSPDKLHPAVGGYQVWADGLKPILTELLGPPAKEDHAPPPTGDPSKARPSAANGPRGDKALDPLFTALRDGDPNVRKGARVLGNLAWVSHSTRAAAALTEGIAQGDLEMAAGAYSFLIDLGDRACEPILIAAFEKYPAKRMANEFLNSGNKTLAAAVEAWADKHGATVEHKSGSAGTAHWGGR